MPLVERAGATLNYIDRGSGPAVILQHPLTSDSRAWEAIGVIKTLEAHGFRVIAPDALGHGKSSASPPDRVSLRSRIDDVIATANQAGIDRFHFAGYSLGGWIGTGLLRDAPNRLLSVAITGWDPVDGARRFTALTHTTERRREFEETVRALTAQTPGRPQPDPERMAGYLDTYERLFTDLPSILTFADHDVPIWIAAGADDPYCTPARASAEALGVTFTEFAGDHVTAFLDPVYPGALVEWLNRCEEER